MFFAMTVILVLAALVGAGVVSRQVLANSRGDVLWGLGHLAVRVYCRVVHRVRVVGHENIPQTLHPGPLILVVNHTAGVDPLLVQSACPFEIRWMMAADMQVAALRWAWEWLNVIDVDRLGRDTTSARQALRHLKNNGVIGIFPEGAIERPPRQIMPFFNGVGLIIARSSAPVLPVIVEGTPLTRHAWGSLLRASRSTIRFLPVMRFGSDSPADITTDLRRLYMDATGWPANNAPRRPERNDHPELAGRHALM
ncbi:MAG: 1-acyl-sn-glycerol-3-phosphate acyltransferase [Phycisphaerales bacterium]|nr:1-acyl-sn-glycerol-3-phosphate acyltransferase [Phycisphaerales bacterium]